MHWNIEYEYPYEERLRDEFAKAALSGFVYTYGHAIPSSAYKKCYEMADEMLRVRQERMKNEQPTSTSSSVQ